MCRAQGSPAFCLANPLVEIAFMGIDAGLDAQFTGVATGLPGVTAQLFGQSTRRDRLHGH